MTPFSSKAVIIGGEGLLSLGPAQIYLVRTGPVATAFLSLVSKRSLLMKPFAEIIKTNSVRFLTGDSCIYFTNIIKNTISIMPR